MHILTMRVKNFRRLKNVRIDLESDISLFVGANNSGKTSASHMLQLFSSASRDRFSVHDFSMSCWREIDDFGNRVADAKLPTIALDIWFQVEPENFHRVVDLLPSLEWEGNIVGIRVEFGASDPVVTLANFRTAKSRAEANVRVGTNGAPDYYPPPRTLREYLEASNSEKLRREFELRYYVLDRSKFDADFQAGADYEPLPLTTDRGRSGRDILASLIRVDVLHAQRHLSDSAGGSRAEDLSRCMSRFYERNLEQSGADYDAQRALADSEAMLNDHLQRVFGPTLSRLADLGYPGLGNPRLLIRTALNPATILGSNDGARVHYALGAGADANPPTLPDRYNGLGFKNLIYMVVELLGLHAQWLDIEENRPPLHLIFIEEPEAHLHAQLQQVFIRKVFDILELADADRIYYASQIVVSTHSPHVLYERGFRPIRYFRRDLNEGVQSSEVLNLSKFHNQTEDTTRKFLERYLKLTHCDLFFADAAILVEGNVERLLMPQMIAKVAPRLQSAYLTTLEIGGAFGHKFRSLVEFLGLTVLLVTDIDSIRPPTEQSPEVGNTAEEAEEVEPEELEELDTDGACLVSVEGAITSNQTLIQWLPGCRTIADILSANVGQRTQARQSHGQALIRVTYQSSVQVNWRDQQSYVVGRTFEEAFAFQNLIWSQDIARASLGLRVRGARNLTPGEIIERLHNKIKAPRFKKTDFALALLSYDPNEWSLPEYIASGLRWLEEQVTPVIPPAQGNNEAVGASLGATSDSGSETVPGVEANGIAQENANVGVEASDVGESGAGS